MGRLVEQQDLLERIIRDANRAYGSLGNPDYSFVLRELKSKKIKDVARKICRTCNAEDITDLDDDVAQVFSIGSSAGIEFWVWCSLVGPYFIVQSGHRVISTAIRAKKFGGSANNIYLLLMQSGLTPVGSSLLNKRVGCFAISPRDEGDPSANVFNILFSPSDQGVWVDA